MSTSTKKKKRERFKELLALRPGIEKSHPGQATNTSINQPEESNSDPENVQSAQLKNLWNLALQNVSIQNKGTLTQNISGLDTLKLLQDLIKIKQNECEARRWRFEYRGRHIILRDLAQKIFKWVDTFKQVGDVVSSFDPVHAALPWAGVRFVLQVKLLCR